MSTSPRHLIELLHIIRQLPDIPIRQPRTEYLRHGPVVPQDLVLGGIEVLPHVFTLFLDGLEQREGIVCLIRAGNDERLRRGGLERLERPLLAHFPGQALLLLRHVFHVREDAFSEQPFDGGADKGLLLFGDIFDGVMEEARDAYVFLRIPGREQGMHAERVSEVRLIAAFALHVAVDDVGEVERGGYAVREWILADIDIRGVTIDRCADDAAGSLEDRHPGAPVPLFECGEIFRKGGVGEEPVARGGTRLEYIESGTLDIAGNE